jgi:integrase/recombinase XerD
MTKRLHSPLASHIEAFLNEKRVCGYRYAAERETLHRFDRFLCDQGCPRDELPRTLVERWTAKQPHERPRTHKARLMIVSQFARYLRRQGVTDHVPDSRLAPVIRLDFTPYIFTREQVRRIFEQADRLPVDSRSPERHLIMPELFRVLYGCGLRAGEAVRLRVKDVDQGVLTIREGKFGKDRLVPLAPALTERLRRYTQALKLVDPETVFFPAPRKTPYNIGTLYHLYRRFLHASAIAHGGRGKGPRLHDLRHTFAVHCLERWYRQDADLNARLPLLVAYLGHKNLSGTQRYLRLTPTVFPDITARLEAFFQSVLAGGPSHEAH